MSLLSLFRSLKGGPNSGNHGHSGRPGKRGGSSPKRGLSIDVPVSDELKELAKYGDVSKKELKEAKEASEIYKQKLEKLGDKLPASHTENLNVQTNLLSNGHGVYDPDNNILDLDFKMAKDMTPHILAHEIGHKVWYHNISDSTRSKVESLYEKSYAPVRDKWNKEWKSGRDFDKVEKEGFLKGTSLPTFYSGVNQFEFFSEGYGMYATNSTQLKKSNPELYNIMRDEVFVD